MEATAPDTCFEGASLFLASCDALREKERVDLPYNKINLGKADGM